jgi:uncharacterized protein (DUF1499 family)
MNETDAPTNGLGHALRHGWKTGLERMWRSLCGPPDLGNVDFATLRRRVSPNDALACPTEFCPQARPDFEPPVFPLPAPRLRAIVSEVASARPDTILVQSGPEQDRYLVRTRLMRFPDTVNVMVIPRSENASTLALYSRSQIGRSDFGVNRRRLGDWVERIGTRVERELRRSSP